MRFYRCRWRTESRDVFESSVCSFKFSFFHRGRGRGKRQSRSRDLGLESATLVPTGRINDNQLAGISPSFNYFYMQVLRVDHYPIPAW